MEVAPAGRGPTFKQDNEPFSLSVIVPNRNDAQYLARCIGSIVTQDVPPDELIILDDVSTDNSVEVISEAICGYPFARLVINQRNLGGGGVGNSNRGLSLAKSKFVYFLGANDFVLPGFFAKIKTGLTMFPHAGLWSAMVWLADEDGNYIRMHPSPVVALWDRLFSPVECRKMMLSIGNWLTGQTTVYRREALVEAGGFDASLKALCDLLAAHVVASRYGAAYLPQPLAVMRIHRDAFLVNTLSDTAVLDSILADIAKRGPTAEPALFTPAMLERTRLRFHFASLRLSKGATLQHVRASSGPLRRWALSMVDTIPSALGGLRTGFYFLVIRPFDILPTLWYRLLGASLVLLREKRAGRVPPK
jgi:glycosyltransferase involved in cell wall biosynthesis